MTASWQPRRRNALRAMAVASQRSLPAQGPARTFRAARRGSHSLRLGSEGIVGKWLAVDS